MPWSDNPHTADLQLVGIFKARFTPGSKIGDSVSGGVEQAQSVVLCAPAGMEDLGLD